MARKELKKRSQLAHQLLLLESCIAMMTLITASVISSSIYFAMNTAENVYAKPEHLETLLARYPETYAELAEYTKLNDTMTPEHLEAARARYPEIYAELVKYANEQRQLYAAQALAAQEYTENLATPENADNPSIQIEAKELLKWAELTQKNQSISAKTSDEDPPVSITYLLSRIRLFFFPAEVIKPEAHKRHTGNSSPSS